MSCDGTMIGLPFAGDRMLLVDIIRTRASSCASRLSGTWTDIWSTSQSALKAAQTQIGRASCRDRVSKYVLSSVASGSLNINNDRAVHGYGVFNKIVRVDI